MTFGGLPTRWEPNGDSRGLGIAGGPVADGEDGQVQILVDQAAVGERADAVGAGEDDGLESGRRRQAHRQRLAHH